MNTIVLMAVQYQCKNTITGSALLAILLHYWRYSWHCAVGNANGSALLAVLMAIPLALRMAILLAILLALLMAVYSGNTMHMTLALVVFVGYQVFG